ncbi:MAG: class I SAM-dependent methyltransferase [Symploca sp. SIO2C1]|nr:class I SAM-dependent methyltransferase [Symploca sp. SIO2C1]
MTNDQPLYSIIASSIAATPQQRITFAEYMDLVLYHPQYGYYNNGAVNIGSKGDFFTSPHLGKDFGELLAEQFAQMWEILGEPTPFTLMEMGAGQGLLAGDILSYLHSSHPDCFAAVEYIIVEKAAGLISQQQQLLQKLQLPITDNDLRSACSSASLSLPVRWCALEEIPENSLTGCCFSNELVDALPVHQFVIEQGQLREIYVTTRRRGEGDEERKRHGDAETRRRGEKETIPNSQFSIPKQQTTNNKQPTTNNIQFVEVTDTPSTPRLKEYFDLVGIDLFSGAYPEGYRSEVNLAALDWLNNVAKRLQRGFLLTIDYGYSAQRYYLPARHQGTLQCYYHHRHHDDPYWCVGQQDITAHINFTALERQGELCGLHQVGFTQQGMFLMALGLGERLAALSAPGEVRGQAVATGKDLMTIMQRREVLHQLIDPMGLGNFGVLVQSKGLTEEEGKVALKGLTVPPMF